MYTFKNYVLAESVPEAWDLKQKRNNRILGGGMWLRLGGDKNFSTAIDMSWVGLDAIEENDEEFCIGCMTPLRHLETDPVFKKWFDGMPGRAVSSIVGTQFRNTATVGGSIYGRFGFSDVLTAFMALDTTVEMFKGGMIPLEKFAEMPYDRDILVNIHVKKEKIKSSYQSLRLTSTDFPIVNAAVSRSEDGWKIAVGARPGRAKLVPDAVYLPQCPGSRDIAAILDRVRILPYASNNMASAGYRQAMAAVLVRRAMREILGEDEA